MNYSETYMKHLEQSFQKLQIFLRKSKKIGIISHCGPDGDTVGCNLALRHALESMGKEVTSICCDDIPEKYQFLDAANTFQKELNVSRFDLIITVDIAAKQLIGFEPEQAELFKFFPLINIDHHPDNQLFGNLNIVDETSASATMILFRLFRFLHVPITRDMATALMLGMYYDTGSFMHSNTSPAAYDMAGELLRAGADMRLIVQNLFRYFPANRLKLWGEVFKRTKMNPHQVVSSVITKHDFQVTQTCSEDLTGVVEYLNMVPESQFALLLTEDENQPQVKGSLRTLKDDVDVSAIAHKYGGGGHKKASGFRIQGKLEEEVTWKIVNGDNEDVIKNVNEM